MLKVYLGQIDLHVLLCTMSLIWIIECHQKIIECWQGNQSLDSMVNTLGANYVGRSSNLTTALWGGDLMVGNPCDPLHLRVWELWVRIVVSHIIAQMCHMPCQIRVQVGRDNDHTCKFLFFYYKIYIYIYWVVAE